MGNPQFMVFSNECVADKDGKGSNCPRFFEKFSTDGLTLSNEKPDQIKYVQFRNSYDTLMLTNKVYESKIVFKNLNKKLTLDNLKISYISKIEEIEPKGGSNIHKTISIPGSDYAGLLGLDISNDQDSFAN